MGGMPPSSVPHVRGLVLAAGSGSRFGQPKALALHGSDGATWVERAVRVVLDGGCDGVTVVVGAAAAEVAAAALGRVIAPSTGLDVVECADWAEGMGASLRTGLTHLGAAVTQGPGPVEAALVMLVDLPDVGPDVVRRLLDTAPHAIDSAHEAAPATWGSALTRVLSRAAYLGVPGHPALIGREHWDSVVASARGDRGARDYFAEHPPQLVECGDLATGRDVDTRSDLQP